MATVTGVTGVVAGVVDGSSSIIQHMQELQKNPSDPVAYAQVNADFQNTVAAMTALAPGLGASTAFVALSADFTLLLQKARNGTAITPSDIVPIAGNLVTLAGQVVAAAGLAGTPATGGISLPLGLTLGEFIDGAGAAINLGGLGLDLKDVRATLGQLSTALDNANSTATTEIPAVIITGTRVTTIDTTLSSDGHTRIETLSDQSSRYTTVSPDGTSITKVYKEADGTISSTQVQIYSDSSRSTLVSTVDTAPDPETNKTTITTTNFDPADGKSTGYSTEVLDNGTGAVTGSASGAINQNGEIISASLSGAGVSINANNASITLNSGSQVNSSGEGNTVAANNGSSIAFAEGSSATVTGDNLNVSAAEGNTLSIQGSSNTISGVAGDSLTIGGNGSASPAIENIYANGATVDIQDNSRANIIGDNDFVVAGNNDNYGVYGSSNWVFSDASSNIWLGGNGSAGNDVVFAYGGTVSVYDGFEGAIASAGTIYAGSNDFLTVSGGNTSTIVSGNGTGIENFNASDVTTVYGADDTTFNYGNNDITRNYGSGDDTYEYGVSDQNYNYGSNEYDYNGDASDTNYDANGTDTSGGYSPDPGDGGDGGGGYGGYGGYYGVANKAGRAAAIKGSNIASVARFDQTHGKPGAALIAMKAHAEIDHAIAQNAEAVLSGAKWAHNTISWSLGSGGQFSSSMNGAEEQAVKQAFAEWSAASGLTFVEVSSKAHADITVGMGSFDTANTSVVGFTTFKAKGGEIQPGAVVRVEDVSEDALVAAADGASAYGGTDASFNQALLHEIGHALGFGDNASPSSVESYYLNGDNRNLSSNDIAQAASLYGKNGAAAHITHQMVQAMSAFAPPQVAHTEAANDALVVGRPTLFGGTQAHGMR